MTVFGIAFLQLRALFYRFEDMLSDLFVLFAHIAKPY